MHTHVPLDDQLNRFFYVEGAALRLVYDRTLGRCTFRPEGLRLDLGSALADRPSDRQAAAIAVAGSADR